VTRDEFEAVRAMAQKAREENDALTARIAALEGQLRGQGGSEASGMSSEGPVTPSL
jgi:BMFP domain-containing protein YqiC